MKNLEEQTKKLLKENHLYANKKLGQNFLINQEVVDGIVEGANVTKDDFVIEIGPGLGTLTEKLIENAGYVLAIELDKNMVSILKKRFNTITKFDILNEDVLKVNLEKIIDEVKSKYKLKNAKVVANLPYYITTPIIMKLLEEKLNLESITVMVQKEVANRLAEVPGGNNTGAITYTINYYTEPKIIIDVPRNCFMPEPEVDSAVLYMKVLKTCRIKVSSEEKLFEVIKYAFMQKRKTLINSLSGSGKWDKEIIKKALQELGIEENIRGERLSLEQFALLSEAINN